MRTRITGVQLAILDAKQSRAAQHQEQIDRIDADIANLLEIDRDTSVQGTELIARFRNGWLTPAQLCAELRIEVAPTPGRVPSQEALARELGAEVDA